MSGPEALPEGLEQSFLVAAGELGMASASWLFLREVAAEGGDALVAAFRDRLGREFPVLDAVAQQWLEGARGPKVDPAPVLDVCRTSEKVLIVGMEADFLDVLVPQLEGVKLALLRRSPFDVDWGRVLSNHRAEITLLDLDTFQRWAGPRSTLLTFAYGVHGANVHVLPGWMRVIGEDVRTQFRSIVAWDVLHAPMYVFPRWLVETASDGFTHLIT